MGVREPRIPLRYLQIDPAASRHALKTLLLSLAVSDVGVGLLGQPIFVSMLVKWLQQNNPGCNTYKAFICTGQLFSSASFLGVVAVSVDRFLAIHLHLRYQELVTQKRVVVVVILIWVWSFASLSVMWVLFAIFSLTVAVILNCLCPSYNDGPHQDLFSCKTP